MASIKILLRNLAIPLFLLFTSTLFEIYGAHGNILCFEKERVALLNVKKSLNDTSGCLSSWVGEDCCKWNGVRCNNQTGHVVKLHLNRLNFIYNNGSIMTCSWSPLRGELNPSLVDLKYLNYLDLSSNDLQGIPSPNFLGSLSMLHYLDLSSARFSEMISSRIGNLSNLYHLSLSCIILKSYLLCFRFELAI